MNRRQRASIMGPGDSWNPILWAFRSISLGMGRVTLFPITKWWDWNAFWEKKNRSRNDKKEFLTFNDQYGISRHMLHVGIDKADVLPAMVQLNVSNHQIPCNSLWKRKCAKSHHDHRLSAIRTKPHMSKHHIDAQLKVKTGCWAMQPFWFWIIITAI